MKFITKDTLISVVAIPVVLGCFVLIFLWLLKSDSTYSTQNIKPTPPPSYNGQDVWQSVNEYRKVNLVKELRLSEELCNGMVDRWIQLKDNWSHDGYQDFVKNKKASGVYSRSLVDGGELFGYGYSTVELMDSWKGSPSHNQALLNTKFNEGCAYSHEGKSLVFLGVRKN